MSAEVVVYGKLSIRIEQLQGMTFDECKEKNPTIKERLLKGAWEIANPKTEKKEKKTKDA